MTDEKSNADELLDRLAAKRKAEDEAGLEPLDLGFEPLDVTRIIINGVPRETHRQLQALAFRSKCSLSQLGLIAVERLLHDADSGNLPLPPPGVNS